MRITEDLIMNEWKALHMNQTLVVVHYEWTKGCGPGNGPWVFCSSREGVTGKREGVREKGCERGGAKKAWQSYPSRLMETTSFLCINSRGVSHLATLIDLATAAAAHSYLDLNHPGLATAAAFNTWFWNILSLQKAFCVTFYTVPNRASHPCNHSPLYQNVTGNSQL